MKITYKTKQEVTINSRTLEKAIVYMELNNVECRMYEEQYCGKVEYYIIKEDGTRATIDAVNSTFSFPEADQIGAMSGLHGNTLTEINMNVYRAATMYTLDTFRYFGLTGADWEEVLPEVEVVV